MVRKHRDLQPWLDYFDMFKVHEHQGLLEVSPPKHEAYATQPALHALTPGSDPQEQVQTGAILDTLRHLRTYAAFRAQQGTAYLREPFALHLVAPDGRHEPLCTILLTPLRSARTLWQWRDKVEVINYNEPNEQNL